MWRTDSTAGACIWDTEPMTQDDIANRNEEIEWLTNHERHNWQLVNGRLKQSGDPTASLGYYSGLAANPPVAAQTSTAVTTATPGTTIWTVGIYTPILGNAVVAGSGYRVAASGTVQTSTSSLTLTLLPSIGSGSVNSAPTNHQDLGVSGAASLGTTLTAGWRLEGDLTIRSAGTSGTAWFMGSFFYSNTTLPAASGASLSLILGGTAATVDWTGATASVPGGFQMSGWGAATVTVVTQQVHWISL